MAVDVTRETPIAPMPLNPGVMEVIRASAGRLIHAEEAFTQQLQRDLVSLMPDLPVLRAAAGWGFCERMVRALLWGAVTDQPPVAVADGLRQLGVRNRLDGFPETQYVAVAHALVRAVRDLSDDDWTTTLASAWIAYFTWAKPHLLAGAQQAAAEQAALQQQAGWAQAATPDAGTERRAAAAGEVDDLESAANMLDDEDDEDGDPVSYGQIMLSMTSRRDRPRNPG